MDKRVEAAPEGDAAAVAVVAAAAAAAAAEATVGDCGEKSANSPDSRPSSIPLWKIDRQQIREMNM